MCCLMLLAIILSCKSLAATLHGTRKRFFAAVCRLLVGVEIPGGCVPLGATLLGTHPRLVVAVHFLMFCETIICLESHAATLLHALKSPIVSQFVDLECIGSCEFLIATLLCTPKRQFVRFPVVTEIRAGFGLMFAIRTRERPVVAVYHYMLRELVVFSKSLTASLLCALIRLCRSV